MFKKNCCPGCGVVTGWLAGEMCSSRCEREVLVRTGRTGASREAMIPRVDAIDAESQKLSTRRPDAWAYLLTIATELRVLKQKMLKLPDDLHYALSCLLTKYETQRESLEATYGKKPKRIDVATDEEWLQMRPLTDFERQAREKRVVRYKAESVDIFVDDEPIGKMKDVTLDEPRRVTSGQPVRYYETPPRHGKTEATEKLVAGLDMGIGEDGSMMSVVKVGKNDDVKYLGDYHVKYLDYQASYPIPRAVFEQLSEEPGDAVIKKIDPERLTKLALKSPGERIWRRRDIVAGVREQLDLRGLRHVITNDGPTLSVMFFPVNSSGVEYVFNENDEPKAALEAFKKSLVETIAQCSPFMPPAEVQLGEGYSKRTHKVKGKYDAASGTHLDNLAKMLGLERAKGPLGKYVEDDASLRARMYAHDFARGGGTNSVPTPPLTREQQIEKVEYRGERRAGISQGRVGY
jgi:hypothetical protein